MEVGDGRWKRREEKRREIFYSSCSLRTSDEISGVFQSALAFFLNPFLSPSISLSRFR